MAIQFPNSPSQGDSFTASNNLVYLYDGEKWITTGSAQAQGDYVNRTGDVMTGDLTVPSLNGGPLAGFRNQIINGGLDHWQRGGSFNLSGVDGRTFFADRWSCRGTNGSGGTTSISRVLYNEGYAARLTVSGHTDNFYVETRLEAGDARNLAGKEVTFSCFMSTAAPAFYAESRDGSDAYTAITNAPQAMTSLGNDRYSYTFTVPDQLMASSETNLGLIVRVYTNGGNATADGGYDLRQCQLEIGPVATPFEHRPIGTELALCQRYYYQVNTVPGGAGGPTIPGIALAIRTTSNYLTMPALDQMRTSGMRTIATVGFHGPLLNPSKAASVNNDNEWTSWYNGQGNGYKASSNLWGLGSGFMGIYGIYVQQTNDVTSLQVGVTVGQKVISLDAEL